VKKPSKILVIAVVLVFAVTTLTACGKAEEKMKQSKTIDAEETNEKRALMDQYVKEAYERGVFNGAVLLAQGDQIIYENALGFANQETKKNLNINTVFELASVSKQFTASAIMILRDQGKLSLSDKLEKYFPEIPYKDITIKNLLNHTSGLPDYMDWVEETGRKSHSIPNNRIMEKFIVESGIPSYFKPNEGWEYSNTGYALLALIIEKASGLPYETFLQKEIFEPSGMKETRVYHRRLNGKQIDDYAYGYVYENGKYVLPDDSEGSSEVIPLDGIEGDGCVNSTLHDMLRWSLALKEGKVLSHKTQEEMYKPTMYDHGKTEYYGYGWSIRNDGKMGRILSHSGGWPGYSTEFIRCVDKDLTFVFLSNINAADTWGKITFMEGLYGIIKGEEPVPIRNFEELLDRNPETSKYPLFCGTYSDDTEVFMKENKLFINTPLSDKEVEIFPGIGGYFITEEGYSITFAKDKIIIDAQSLDSSVLNKIDK
jgi:CubicO group peptidase (beta-lactamase class C family)